MLVSLLCLIKLYINVEYLIILKYILFGVVIIINIKRFLSIATAMILISSMSNTLVYGENFEQVTSEETLSPPIQITSIESETLESEQDTYPNEPDPEDPPPDEPSYDDPPQDEPSYDEPPQDEPPQEETTIEETTTEETTTYIQEAAFMYTVSNNEAILISCKTPALTKIDIPDIIDGYPVTTISENVFVECYNAIEINVPYCVKTISDGAFRMCNSLQYIGVATENKHYKSVNGVLYNFLGTSILAYPSGKPETSYTVAEGVQYIGGNCFNSCSNLESLKLPPTLNIIGHGAFNGCINLKELTVNNNVELSPAMFDNCNLETIYGYENSKAESYADKYGIAFESIGVLETNTVQTTTEVTSVEVTTIIEESETQDTVTAESLVYYAPERSGTDRTQKIVIVIIIIAMISFVVAVASKSRHNDEEDDDDEDDDEEDNDDDNNSDE